MNSHIKLYINAGPQLLKKILYSATEDSDAVPDARAVSVIGRNVGKNGEPVWVFNENQAFDREGNECAIEDYGLRYISNGLPTSVKSLSGVAAHKASTTIETPLSSTWFDAVCHFLKGEWIFIVYDIIFSINLRIRLTTSLFNLSAGCPKKCVPRLPEDCGKTAKDSRQSFA